MKNPEATMPTFHDTTFETAWTDGNSNVPISSWEVTLNDESKSWLGEVIAGANLDPDVEQESHPTESLHINDEDLIARRVKSALKSLVTT